MVLETSNMSKRVLPVVIASQLESIQNTFAIPNSEETGLSGFKLIDVDVEDTGEIEMLAANIGKDK